MLRCGRTASQSWAASAISRSLRPELPIKITKSSARHYQFHNVELPSSCRTVLTLRAKAGILRMFTWVFDVRQTHHHRVSLRPGLCAWVSGEFRVSHRAGICRTLPDARSGHGLPMLQGRLQFGHDGLLQPLFDACGGSGCSVGLEASR